MSLSIPVVFGVISVVIAWLNTGQSPSWDHEAAGSQKLVGSDLAGGARLGFGNKENGPACLSSFYTFLLQHNLQQLADAGRVFGGGRN